MMETQMADDMLKLDAQIRTQFGKGASRRARRAELTPAVLYGHGTDPVHLLLPAQPTSLALRQANAVIELAFDGDTQLALVKDVQRDVLKPLIKHVDFIVIRKGQKVTVEVAIVVEGEVTSEALVNLENQTIALSVDALNIPESIEVNVEGMEIGDQVLSGDLKLPEGAELDSEDDLLVLNIAVAEEEDLSTPEDGEGEGDIVEEGDGDEADGESADED